MDTPSSLTHYRILKPLGRGGMGEVFLAEDTRLRRQVAIKLVANRTATDPERRRQLEREALAIAALNHPNVVTIHGVEEADGLPFIVMELVEGQTLADILAAGAMTTAELLRVGAAVSDAVGAAHERHIVHRDLKPQNVMLTRDGRVKVLDFGLARFREPDSGDAAATVTATHMSGDGRIVGTVAYMSPEQAEGKPLDARSDIFSLGVMLHEMATGDRPFKGDTTASIISAILRDTPPPVTHANPSLPSRLGRIIGRALAKDPSQRYQHAFDLRNELQDLRDELSSGSLGRSDSPPSGALRSRRAAVAAVVGAVIVATGAYGAYVFKSRHDGTATGFDVHSMTRLTSTGTAAYGAISPDGRHVVHVKVDDGRPSLWVRQTATTSDVQIVPPGDSLLQGMSFSRDGNYVFYTAHVGSTGYLYRVPALGGTPQRLLEDIDSQVTFSPDGRQLAFLRGSPVDHQTYLIVGDADGTNLRRLAAMESPYQFELEGVAWSPDGATLLTTARSVEGGPHDVPVQVDVTTGRVTPIGDRWALANELDWLPDGRSFMLVGADFSGAPGAGIWQVSFPDGARRRVTTDLAHYQGLSISRDGQSLATVRLEFDSSIWVAPASAPAAGRKVLDERGNDLGVGGVAWTPNGELIYSSTKSGRIQLWASRSDGSEARQLTDVPLMSINPAVSPDGSTVFFEHYDARRIALASVSITGAQFKEVVKGAVRGPTVSPDGKWLYYADSGRGVDQLYRVDLAGGKPEPLSDDVFSISGISPDGSQLIGTSWIETEKRFALGVIPAAKGSIRRIDHPPNARSATFAPDGQSVIYLARGNLAQLRIYRQSLRGGAPVLLGELPDVVFAWDWSADGTRVVLSRGTARSDVVLLSRRNE